MLIYIILIILLFTLYSKVPDQDKKTDVNNIKNVKRLRNITDDYLTNFNPNEKNAYFNLFKFLNQIELNSKESSKNFVILGYNSYKLPDQIIKIVQKHQDKFQDVEDIGLSVENEIKAFILKINKSYTLESFLRSFEYLSEIYYPTDEIVKLNICNQEYLYSNKMNQVLTFFKGDEDVSNILYYYNQKLLECQQVI